jgi:Uma2 family endonuclease
MTVDTLRRTFTVDELYRMLAAGILSEDDRTELLDGELFRMIPISARHAAVLKRLNHSFTAQTGRPAIVSVQDPIHLDERSEPQPDLCVLTLRDDFYAERHPRAEEVLLLIEVSDTSRAHDRQTKLPLYDRHRIREVWLSDLIDEQVLIRREPVGDGYEVVETARRGDRIAPRELPDAVLQVERILP